MYKLLSVRPGPEGAESERDGGDTVRAETGRTLGGHPVHDPLVPLRRGRHAQTGRRHGVAAQ